MVDVCDLIRNKEIAEFGRKNWNLNANEKLGIILSSYVPIDVRYKYLKDFLDEYSNDSISGVTRICERLYREFISRLNSSEENLYSLSIIYSNGENTINGYRTYDDEVHCGYFSSMKEVYDHIINNYNEKYLFELDILDKENREPLYLAYIGYFPESCKWEIFKLYDNEGIEDNIMLKFSHKLIYKSGDRITIQFPNNNIPIETNIFYNSKHDYCLLLDDGESIDFTPEDYFDCPGYGCYFDNTSPYSILDFII